MSSSERSYGATSAMSAPPATAPALTSASTSDALTATAVGATAPTRPASEGPTFKLYTRRFLMLFAFSFASLMSSMFQLSFATIQNLVMEYFNVTSGEVNLLSMVFMILYIPFTVVSTWTITRFGLRSSLIFGAIVTAGGSWIRYWGVLIGDNGFWVLFGGQSLAAVAQPFVVNGVTSLAGNWFGENERSTAVTVGTLMSVAGMGAAFILGPMMVHNGTEAQLESELLRFMLVMSIASSAAAVLTALCYREAPSTPPSASAEASGRAQANKEAAPSFWQTMKTLLTNAEFMKLVLAFGFGYGAMMPLYTTINQVFLPEGFTEQETGLLGVIMTCVGTPGSFVAAFLMARTGKFKLLLVIGCLGVAVSIAAVPVLMITNTLHMAGAIAALSALSFFAMALMPLGMELGVEVTYPVPESASTSVLYLAIMLFAVVITFVCDQLQSKLPPYKMTNALWFTTGLTGFATLSALSLKERYLRQEFERAAQAAGEKIPLSSSDPALIN